MLLQTKTRAAESGVSEEQQYWRKIIDELNEKFTLQYIASEIGVSERQVSNWKRGDRPIGMNAVRLVTFHAKHRTPVQETGTPVRSAEKKD